MNRLKTHWAALSRSVRILLLLLVQITAGFVAYIALGSPPLTVEMGYRRAEKAHMIGPMQTLTEVQLERENSTTSQVIVAQSNEYEILYFHSDQGLYVYPKSEQPSLYCLSYWLPHAGVNGIQKATPLHLILFDRNPEAKSATIHLTPSHDRDVSIQGISVREYDDFFCFSIIPQDSKHASILQRIQIFSMFYSEPDRKYYPLTVSLYDKDGKLLSNQTILPGPSIDLSRGDHP